MKFHKFDRAKLDLRATPFRAKPHKPLLEQLEDRRMLAAVAWTGGGDGTSWQDSSNWSNGAVPTTADDVTIDVAANPVIEITGRTAQANSLLATERLVPQDRINAGRERDSS